MLVSVTVAGTMVVDTREGSLVLGNLGRGYWRCQAQWSGPSCAMGQRHLGQVVVLVHLTQVGVLIHKEQAWVLVHQGQASVLGQQVREGVGQHPEDVLHQLF